MPPPSLAVAILTIATAGCVPLPGGYVQSPGVRGSITGAHVVSAAFAVDPRSAARACSAPDQVASVDANGRFHALPKDGYRLFGWLGPATCEYAFYACFKTATEQLVWRDRLLDGCNSIYRDLILDCTIGANGVQCDRKDELRTVTDANAV
jgi:hypothetical protein